MKLFRHQLRAEQLVFWRSREAAVFIFIFPPMLFLLLGSVYSGTITIGGREHPSADVLLMGLTGYGIANTAFAGLAIQLVIRRESGVLKRLRSTPLPPLTYMLAALVSTLLVFALQLVVLFALGRLLFDAALPGGQWLSLVLASLAGVAAFAAIGLAAAALIRSSEGASAVINVVLLPMAFLSGTFGPTRSYPSVLQALGDVLPLKYLIDLLNAVYLGGEQVWEQGTDLAVLAAWGVFAAVLAARRFGWEPRER